MAIARIDEEIDKHLLAVSDQRNSFSPIFRLPPEVLANIFVQCARDYFEGNNTTVRYPPHWVNVSYICRRWRNVALNCPTLWTYHFTLSLRWIDELLARSKQALLKIRIEHLGSKDGSRRWSNLMKRLLNHAERIQELHLYISDKILPEELSTLHAPRLQILAIDIWHYHYARTFTINCGQILPLRTLRLTNCTLSWHSLNLSGVTTLFLHSIPDPLRQSIGEFLTALSRMQALTVLHLEQALASARGFLSSGMSSTSPKVGLPHLSYLYVLAPLSTVVALLSRTNIPRKIRVKLEAELEDGSLIDDYAQLPPVLAQRFSQAEDLSSFNPTIRSLVLLISQCDRSSFAFYASERRNFDPLSSLAPNVYVPLVVTVEIGPLITVGDRDRLISDIFCSVPSGHVDTLHIVDPPFSPDFWRRVLGNLHGLWHMSLRDGFMPDLVSVLSQADMLPDTPRGCVIDGGDPTPSHTFIPALEDLELYRIRFAPDGSLSECAISQGSLLDALSTRKPTCPRLTMD